MDGVVKADCRSKIAAAQLDYLSNLLSVATEVRGKLIRMVGNLEKSECAQGAPPAELPFLKVLDKLDCLNSVLHDVDDLVNKL